MENELLFKAAILEKQSQEISEHLQYLNAQMSELDELSKNLNQITSSKEKESLSSLGKGIFIKSTLSPSDLFINVGSGVIVKKTPKETEETINHQLRNIHEARAHLMHQLEICNHALKDALIELEKEKSAKKN